MTRASVGVICMEPADPGTDVPGAAWHAGTFPLPPDVELVAGGRAVERADPVARRAAYAAAAAELAGRGAAFVTTDCAWNLTLGDAIRDDAGGCPALASILQVLPLLTAVFPTVGVVSIRHERLRRVLHEAEPAVDIDALAIAGVPESGAWRTFGDHPPVVLEDELVDCGARLVEEAGAGALVLDCTTFAPFASAVQMRCGVPAFGLTGLVHYLMGAGVR